MLLGLTFWESSKELYGLFHRLSPLLLCVSLYQVEKIANIIDKLTFLIEKVLAHGVLIPLYTYMTASGPT